MGHPPSSGHSYKKESQIVRILQWPNGTGNPVRCITIDTIRLEALHCTPRLFTWGCLRIAVAGRGVGVRTVVHLVIPLWYCATSDFFCSASAFRSVPAERRFFNFLYFRQMSSCISSILRLYIYIYKRYVVYCNLHFATTGRKFIKY